ncbi:DedA family protein [Schnuerera sp. xch1]|uniref:DedA family protein n=1 Tax=Schnuerera sp. xch1 TaxID=2874283 RepID=UPI001CBED8D5|nr:DedA family protein [Schnuerera sp. xch1]MBZ2174288.1 DedA family protein [Schnuerera sp. xch1]
MEDIILEIINQFGYFGIFLLIAVENIFPPIPSEVILTFGGFMTTFSSMDRWGVVVSATIGSVLGAVILYVFGRVLNIERLENFFGSKLGRILHLKRGDVRKAGKWFIKYGNKAVFLCRFIPIVRSLISIPAGISKMKFSKFLFLTIMGTFIWNVILIYLGRFAGEAWETIVFYIDFYSIIAIMILASTVFVAGVLFIKKRFIENNNKK